MTEQLQQVLPGAVTAVHRSLLDRLNKIPAGLPENRIFEHSTMDPAKLAQALLDLEAMGLLTKVERRGFYLWVLS
jgi:DNA-binding IclR family transcriptional regulator